MTEPREGGGHDPWSPPRQTDAPAKAFAAATRRKGGKDAVAAAIADAEADDRLNLKLGADPAPGQPMTIAGEARPPGEWSADEDGLPPGCPILPLGTKEGEFFFLDTIGQLRTYKEGELGQAGLTGLFMGRHFWLYWAFPRKNADGIVTSWRPEKAREVLMAACARKGSWEAATRVRGRGFWRGQDGRLIVHCGDRLVSARGPKLIEEPLGEMENHVYPTRPAIARPWPIAMNGKEGPALDLIPHFRKWNWSRPKLDPFLLFGHVVIGYMGGAVRWRPELYVLGDKSTGKSSLQEDLREMAGEWLVQTGDTTAAGLYQQLKFDALPVAIDEFEAKADNRKQKAVIELARLSASGAPMNRGGAEHKGVLFYGRSAYLLSSINTPPLDPQDLSRMAILRLKKHRPGDVRPVIEQDELTRLGRQIMRRIIDNWHRWPATLSAWREFLATCGHDGRGQDTFGTLMAAADLAIADDAEALDLEMGPNAERFDSWREALSVANLAEYEDAAENWRLCVNHLLSARIDQWKGGAQHSIGSVLLRFWDNAGPGDENHLPFAEARTLLEQSGVTLQRATPDYPHFCLFIPNQHVRLHAVFEKTKWQGELSAGSWSGALRQAEKDGRNLWREASARIEGVKYKGTAFALSDILMRSDDDA